jgi:hypothetical protein
VLQRFMAEDFERVVVFTLDGESARAWGQLGCRIPPEAVRGAAQDPLRSIEVRIEDSVLLCHARVKEVAFLDSVPDAREDHVVVGLLDARPNDSVLVFPVRWGAETVCVGIGAAPRGAEIFEKASRYDLLSTKLTDAVEIVRLRKRILAV